MSQEFIRSQVEYYRKHLNCGSNPDWNQILDCISIIKDY